jgi:hypothetical protein
MGKINTGWKTFYILLYSFLFIFNPDNFISLNLIHLLFILAVFHLIIYGKIKVRLSLILYVMWCTAVIGYVLIMYITIWENDLLIRGYADFIFLIEAPVCALYIVNYININELFKKNIFALMISITCIQLVFVYLMLYDESIRSWALESSKIKDFESISNQYGLLRSFGLSSGLTYSMPMFLGVINVIFLHYAFFCQKISKRLFWLILSFLTVYAVILNAQVGLLPSVIYIFIILASGIASLFMNKLSGSLYITIAITLLLLAVYTLMSFGLMDFDSGAKPNTLARLSMRLDDVAQLLNGNVSGVFLELMNMHYLVNNQTQLIFGSGIDVFGKHSDIGYIRDINLIGIFGMTLFFLPTAFFVKVLYKSLKREYSSIVSLAIISSIPFFYFKGMIILNNDLMNFLILVIVYYCYKVNACEK